MTRNIYMAWEYVEGTPARDGFWKCTRSNSYCRQSCEAWVRMPVTQSGYVRKSVVVELPDARAHMVRDEAIPDEAFAWAVLRHDLTAAKVAA